MKRRITTVPVALTLAAAVLSWAAITDAWGYSAHVPLADAAFVYAIASRLVWALPAAILIAAFRGSLAIGPRELFGRPRIDAALAAAIALPALFAAAEMLVTHGGLWFNREVDAAQTVAKFAVVGVVEETVFRGWGFNALKGASNGRRATGRRSGDARAIALSTAFFVLLHCPAYVVRFALNGTFDAAGTCLQCLSAALWGVAFCLMLRKNRSLWTPIVAHALYDTLIVLLVG